MTVTTPTTAQRIQRPRRAPVAAVRGVVAVVVLVVVWITLTDLLALAPSQVIPSASETVGRFFQLFVEPFANQTLLGPNGASLTRWGIGVLLAVVLGVPLGLWMGWSRVFEAVVAPLFNALRSIPPLAWIPLAILWLGTGLATEATLVFIAAFPPLVLNSYQAARATDRDIVWASRVVGASSLRQIVEVVVPTELPILLGGLRIAIGNGLMAVVAAELVSARSGLGFLIVRGQQDAQADIILIGMVCIALIGLASDALLNLASRPLLRWRTNDDR